MNFDKMHQELTKLYTELRTGKVDPALAHELNNTAENIQGNIRLGLLHAKMRNESPNLAYFKNGRTTKR